MCSSTLAALCCFRMESSLHSSRCRRCACSKSPGEFTCNERHPPVIVWQPADAGKRPSRPNNLIIARAAHSQLSEHRAAVVCRTFDVLRQSGPVPNQPKPGVQVCQQLRRLVHGRVATKVSLRQPHLTPRRSASLDMLPLDSLTAATFLDLSHCLDWVSHECISNLIDASKLTRMTQLRELNLRPSTDLIDAYVASRIKLDTKALCWADGMFTRVWDRWMYGLSPGIPRVENKPALAALTALESLHFPLTKRSPACRSERAAVAPTLPCLRNLSLGAVEISDEEVLSFACAATLTRLSLGNVSKLSEAALKYIGAMPRLQELLLHGCASMQASGSWEALTPLTDLRLLALQGHPEGENVHFYGGVQSGARSVPMTSSGAHRSGLCATAFCSTLLLLHYVECPGLVRSLVSAGLLRQVCCVTATRVACRQAQCASLTRCC